MSYIKFIIQKNMIKYELIKFIEKGDYVLNIDW